MIFFKNRNQFIEGSINQEKLISLRVKYTNSKIAGYRQIVFELLLKTSRIPIYFTAVKNEFINLYIRTFML